MEQLPRLVILCATLVALALVWSIDREVTAPERMARAGFMPIKLPGDAKTHWIPIPTPKAPKPNPFEGM